jgi:hypothetical protein
VSRLKVLTTNVFLPHSCERFDGKTARVLRT